jgi:hypothetical protein
VDGEEEDAACVRRVTLLSFLVSNQSHFSLSPRSPKRFRASFPAAAGLSASNLQDP